MGPSALPPEDPQAMQAVRPSAQEGRAGRLNAA
jgi:hypothetical protein